MNEKEQADTLWEYGEIVSHRFEPKLKFMLYQLSDFYVEVKYNDETNEIIALCSFRSTKLLEPYIGDVDISECFS